MLEKGFPYNSFSCALSEQLVQVFVVWDLSFLTCLARNECRCSTWNQISFSIYFTWVELFYLNRPIWIWDWENDWYVLWWNNCLYLLCHGIPSPQLYWSTFLPARGRSRSVYRGLNNHRRKERKGGESMIPGRKLSFSYDRLYHTFWETLASPYLLISDSLPCTLPTPGSLLDESAFRRVWWTESFGSWGPHWTWKA